MRMSTMQSTQNGGKHRRMYVDHMNIKEYWLTLGFILVHCRNPMAGFSVTTRSGDTQTDDDERLGTHNRQNDE